MHMCKCLHGSGRVLWTFDANLLRVQPILWQVLCLCILLVLWSERYGLCYVVHRIMFKMFDCEFKLHVDNW